MPTVIRKANGRLIIRSKGKRGFTTVQVTREGEQWLREKFPPSHNSLHELAIDRDLFWEMARGGYLFTERSGRNWIRRVNRRRATEQPVTVDNDYFESSSPRDEVPPARQINRPPVARIQQPVITQPTSNASPAPLTPPAAGEYPLAPDESKLSRLATIAAVKCVSCNFALPEGAHFCPRCGRAVQKQPESRTDTSGGRIFFAVLAGVAAFIVVCWLVTQR